MRRPNMEERILRAVFEELQDLVAYFGDKWDEGGSGARWDGLDWQECRDLYEWVESMMVKMERGLNES